MNLKIKSLLFFTWLLLPVKGKTVSDNYYLELARDLESTVSFVCTWNPQMAAFPVFYRWNRHPRLANLDSCFTLGIYLRRDCGMDFFYPPPHPEPQPPFLIPGGYKWAAFARITGGYTSDGLSFYTQNWILRS